MATPMLFMPSTQRTAQEPTIAFYGPYGESKPESTKPSARSTKKSGKGSNPKKQPQRGLGVAQLERLRLQDRWKKMTELPQHQQPQVVVNLPAGHPHQYLPNNNIQHQNPPAITLPSVPVQYGVSSYNGPALINGATGGNYYGLVGQRVGNGTCGLGYVGGNHNLVVLDPNKYGSGAPDPRFEGAVYETSKELSSMPKIQSLPSNSCDLCSKHKKRFNSTGNHIGFNGRSDKSTAVLPINGSDFIGMKPEPNSFGARVARRAAGYLGQSNPVDDDQGVGVRAVHRKGNSASGEIFTEYEFFPSAAEKSRSTYPKEEIEMLQTVEAANSASVGSHEEASDTAAATAYYNGYGIGAADSSYHQHQHHHHPIDLSLKLSF